MNVTVTLFGKTYRRDYELRFCALPGCGKRVPFRVLPSGRPEGSDKQARRETCCPSHGRQLHALRLRERYRQERESGPVFGDGVCGPGDLVQQWLCRPRLEAV